MYNFDQFGIPLQLDGDGGDALWKLGVRRALLKFLEPLNGAGLSKEPFTSIDNYRDALLQLCTKDGRYFRYFEPGPAIPPWNDPKDTSRDQLKPNFIAMGLDCDDPIIKWRADKLYNDLNKAGRYPNGDLLGPELDMFFIRIQKREKDRWKLPFLDAYMMGSTLIRIGILPRWDHDNKRLSWERSDDVSDDISHSLSLMYCNLVWPTETSKKALEYYLRFRPKVSRIDQKFIPLVDNVSSAWFRYFRDEAKNSVEIAWLFYYAKQLHWD